MSNALLGLAAAIIVNGSMPDSAPGPVIVQSSPGGRLAQAIAQAPGLVIDGKCQSACAWAFAVNPTSCFTDRAIIGFHGFRDPGTGALNAAANAYWLERASPRVRQAIGDDVLTGEDIALLTADVLGLLLPEKRCEVYP